MSDMGSVLLTMNKGPSLGHTDLFPNTIVGKRVLFLLNNLGNLFLKKDLLLIKEKRTYFWELFHCLCVCFHASLTQFGLLLFLLSVEIRKHESSGFVLLSQDCLGTRFLFCCFTVSLGFDVLSSHGHSSLTVF